MADSRIQTPSAYGSSPSITTWLRRSMALISLTVPSKANAASGMAVCDECKLKFLELKAKRNLEAQMKPKDFAESLPANGVTMLSMICISSPMRIARKARFFSLHGGKVNEVPVIRIYGSTPAGQKTCLHVHGIYLINHTRKAMHAHMPSCS